MASSGEEALEAVSKQEFDIIFMDLFSWIYFHGSIDRDASQILYEVDDIIRKYPIRAFNSYE